MTPIGCVQVETTNGLNIFSLKQFMNFRFVDVTSPLSIFKRQIVRFCKGISKPVIFNSLRRLYRASLPIATIDLVTFSIHVCLYALLSGSFLYMCRNSFVLGKSHALGFSFASLSGFSTQIGTKCKEFGSDGGGLIAKPIRAADLHAL